MSGLQIGEKNRRFPPNGRAGFPSRPHVGIEPRNHQPRGASPAGERIVDWVGHRRLGDSPFVALARCPVSDILLMRPNGTTRRAPTATTNL